MNIIEDSGGKLDGLQQLLAVMEAGGRPPIAETMNFAMTTVEPGFVVFEGRPDRRVYNPIGSVHGGYAATLLDSACGCAIHSKLSADQAYTTLELKVSYHRPLSEMSGLVRAEGRIVSIGRRAGFAEARLIDEQGKLCASATSTLLIFDRVPARSA